MQRNDILWKGLIEDIFPYFIPFFLPQYEELFDLAKPAEFLDKELQQLFPQEEDMQHPKFVDKLVKVFTNSGQEQWVLIHIEVQGQQDNDFARRMFTYFYRILDRYGVLVTAIALFTDNNPAYKPNCYAYDFAGTRNTYHFNTFKVLQQDEQALEQSNNPFAIAVLTVLLALKKKHKLQDEDLFLLKTTLFRKLYAKQQFSESLRRSLFTFLDMYLHFDKPETKSKFEAEINSITQNKEPMGLKEIAEKLIAEREKQYGREEGREVGREEGREVGREEGFEQGTANRNYVIVSNIIHSTDFADEKIAMLTDVSVEFVEKLRQEIGK